MTIIDRATAKSIGLKKYFTGIPCPHGHISERRTGNGNCIACEQTPENKMRMVQNATRANARNRAKDLDGFRPTMHGSPAKGEPL